MIIGGLLVKIKVTKTVEVDDDDDDSILPLAGPCINGTCPKVPKEGKGRRGFARVFI